MAIDSKDKSKTPENIRKSENQKFGFNFTVSEGSTVIFDLRQFLGADTVSRHQNVKSYSFLSCRQISGITVGEIKENDQIISFKAPYIRSDDLITNLEFELRTGTKKNDDITVHNVHVTVKRVQRVMVFQGGVALGAYEAGVFRALVKRLRQQDRDEGRITIGAGEIKRPLFDIIAGTSIGGMNAAVVVNNIIKGKSWEDSAEKVVGFWQVQKYPLPTLADILDKYPLYRNWWDTAHRTGKEFKQAFTRLLDSYSDTNPVLKSYGDMLSSFFSMESNSLMDYFIDGWYIPATAEAARRYYSGKQIQTFGSPNVAAGLWPWSILGKFFDFTVPDNVENALPRPDNKHYVMFSLKRTLENFVDFPIKTKEGQPRFLLVTVDAQTGDAVTFDSYCDKAIYHDNRSVIYNKEGIEIEHALATGTFPTFFDYPKFGVDNSEMAIRNEDHIFWDGGFRSNTPLREVIQAHRDYWLSKARMEHKGQEYYEYENDVPDLEIYVADLWPSELQEKPISFDLDFVQDRQWDLLLGDKTDYDEQVANIVSDYVHLVREFKNLAVREGASKDEINYILSKYATSKSTKGQTRKYEELLEGRFRLTKVVRIDHTDDGNDVSKKIFDYSNKTIENLINDGYQDALVQMDLQRIKDRVSEIAKRNNYIGNTEMGKPNSYIQKLEEDIHQIKENMKISRYTIILYELVPNFINDVDSIQVRNGENQLSLKEKKASLIAAAEQFQDTIKDRIATHH
jgi:NTE family protein